MIINIYSDGACSGNPGPGGYASYIISNELNLLIYGSKNNTTNNCMELTAVIAGLKHVFAHINYRSEMTINVYTDSAYVVNALNEGWVYFWEKNLWQTKRGTKVKNEAQWKKILEFVRRKNAKINFIKIKGHNGNVYNETVDKYAKAAIKELLEEKVN